jgi:hypothetical protein
MIGNSRAVLFLGLAASVSAFAPSRQSLNSQNSQLSMGFFDDLKNVFGDEGKEQRIQLVEQRKAEEEEAQRLMVERRRNPEKMEEYEEMVTTRRLEIKGKKSKLEIQQEDDYIADEK